MSLIALRCDECGYIYDGDDIARFRENLDCFDATKPGCPGVMKGVYNVDGACTRCGRLVACECPKPFSDPLAEAKWSIRRENKVMIDEQSTPRVQRYMADMLPGSLMSPQNAGQWVRYSDYVRLQSAYEALAKDCRCASPVTPEPTKGCPALSLHPGGGEFCTLFPSPNAPVAPEPTRECVQALNVFGQPLPTDSAQSTVRAVDFTLTRCDAAIENAEKEG